MLTTEVNIYEAIIDIKTSNKTRAIRKGQPWNQEEPAIGFLRPH